MSTGVRTGPHAVVIGIGNVFRRDDGVGPAVAAALETDVTDVRVVTCAAEPAAILDAWTGAEVAVVVDAAIGPAPGEVRRCALDELVDSSPLSSHELSLRQTIELGRALDRAPRSVSVVSVGVADTGHGEGLSPEVAAALPEALRVVRTVLAEQSQESAHQQP